MELLNLSSRKRETYEVELTYSLLWETVLGIAAITNKSLLSTLEKSSEYWNSIKENLSQATLQELDFVEKNNTWKSLLLLLHARNFNDLNEFILYIQELSEREIKLACIPYLGAKHDHLREEAISGDSLSLHQMKEISKHNPFYPNYIDFICKVDFVLLKKHLVKIMSGWFLEVTNKEKQEVISNILRVDYESKLKMKETMTASELVEWATGGLTYVSEPGVSKVLLIPHYTYRPWNIEADLKGTKVFYYPVANESLTPEDPYTPNHLMVLKYKALGDEIRLRMVKILFEKDQTLQEITDQLNLGKSTVHHHLKILRSARLVEIKEQKYSLIRKALEFIPNDLSTYLNQ